MNLIVYMQINLVFYQTDDKKNNRNSTNFVDLSKTKNVGVC